MRWNTSVIFVSFTKEKNIVVEKTIDKTRVINSHSIISRMKMTLTLKDCTNVHNKIRIVSPCRSSFISRAARNKRKNPTLMKFSCKIEKEQKTLVINMEKLVS